MFMMISVSICRSISVMTLHRHCYPITDPRFRRTLIPLMNWLNKAQSYLFPGECIVSITSLQVHCFHHFSSQSHLFHLLPNDQQFAPYIHSGYESTLRYRKSHVDVWGMPCEFVWLNRRLPVLRLVEDNFHIYEEQTITIKYKCHLKFLAWNCIPYFLIG